MIRAAAALAAALSLSSCSWGPLHDEQPPPPPPPADTAAPTLAVRPAGGSYAAVQYVTLAADEPATVRYTLDGADPALAGTSVIASESPAFWIRIGPGTTVLRAVAVDRAGNVSAPVSETYAVEIPPPDFTAPTLTLLEAPAGFLPLLATTTATWRSDEAVEWGAAVVGASLSSPRVVAAGSASAGAAMAVPVHGWDLPPGGVGTLLVRATDAAGLHAALEVALGREPAVLGTTVGGYGWCEDLALSPDGRRAYFAADVQVKAIDADPASPTFDAPLATYPLPEGSASSLAIAPDGGHLWVGCGRGLLAMDALTGQASFVATVAGGVDGVVAASDGRRLFASSGDGRVFRFEVDPAGTVTGATALPARTGPAGAGSLVLAAAERRLFAGTTVVDADPASPDRDRQVGTIVVAGSVVSRPAPAPGDGPVFTIGCSSPDGPCVLQAFHPLTLGELGRATVAASWTWSAWALAVTPDGEHVLAMEDSGPNAGVLRVFRASDLVELGGAALGAAGSSISLLRVAPDGTRAYARVYGDYGPDFCRAVRVPLR